ncbi:protein LURP-one-related 15 [Carica papaya]|uniref:Tubby structurally-related protein n=1 Tax=Carica papaya TaxID=3649 RepID=E0WMM4_CARPA|nr:protein LURP-one-related 15 [Carica papaya]CBW47299.1 tubby structurally-related protein [Carica papaya]
MAGLSYLTDYPPAKNPVVVVSPQFLAPYPVDLIITKKLFKLGETNFEIADVNGKIFFTLKSKFISLRDRRVLLDASGAPLLTLQQKIITAHRRWQVFKGGSTDQKDLLFSAKKSSLIQLKTELFVFLAQNTSESACDFKVKGSWLERACTIYLGDSNTIIGQMHKQHTVQSILLDKDSFAVTVYPHVDYAFIVALVIILYEINEDRSGDD